MQTPAVGQAIAELEALGRQALDADRVARNDQTMNAALDLRFAGQSYEITVPIGRAGSVMDRFLAEHLRLYGYAPKDKPIELVAARLEALGPTPTVTPTKPTVLRQQCGGINAATDRYLQRDTLAPGTNTPGPLIIEEYACTTVVPAGWSIALLTDGQILLENKGDQDV